MLAATQQSAGAFEAAVMVIAVAISALVTVFAVATARRASRIRVGYEIARIAVGLGAVVAVAAITRVVTPLPIALLAILVGIGLGFAQGRALRVEVRDDMSVATRSLWGVALWAAGLIVMQVAGLASRVGVLRVGQAIALLSVGMLGGVIWGRARPLLSARATALGLVPVVIAGAGVVLTIAAPAAGQESCAEGSQDPVCVEAERVIADAIDSGLLDSCEEQGYSGESCNRLFEALYLQEETTFGITTCVFPYSESDICREQLGNTSGSDPGGQADQEAPPEPASTDSSLVQPTGDEDTESGIQPGEAPASEQDGAEGTDVVEGIDVTTEEGLATAVAAVIAAVAMGALTLAEAGQSLTDIFDRAGWEAIRGGHTTDVLLDPFRPPESPTDIEASPPPPPLEPLMEGDGAARSAPRQSQGGVGSGPMTLPPGAGPVRRTSVVLTGEDAERAIRDGIGGRVRIPAGEQDKDRHAMDQQWGLDVRDADTTHKADHIGAQGKIEDIGPVATDADGNTVVTVEVAVGGAQASGTGLDIQDDPRPPTQTGDPGPTRAPVPDIQDDPRPPGDRGDPGRSRTPDPGLDLAEEPRQPRSDDGPGRTRPPPPPQDERRPDDGSDGTGVDPDPPPLEPIDGDGTGPEDGTPPPPDISDREVRDIVERGIRSNRSPDDIQEDLDGLSQARGGGGVPLPEELESVETPLGRVTSTSTEAEAYRRALAEREANDDALAGWRRLITDNQKEIAKWTELEKNWAGRWMAGLGQLAEERSEYLAARRALEDKLARINRPPDPMTYDRDLYDSYADAANPAKRRSLQTDVNREMEALREEHTRRVQRFTETTEGGSEPYPMAADIYDAAYDDTSHLPWGVDADTKDLGMAERGPRTAPDAESPPSSRDGSSWLNRPYEEMRRWADEQERLLDRFREDAATADRLQEQIDSFEARATRDT